MNVFRKAILAAACVGSLVAVAAPALAETTLRAVMHSDLKILDPIWTTAYIVRNHGYMIYDTLLAQDEKGDIKLQMLEKYETAPDNKSYTFTLRDGLLWHDGQPVTSEDCIASIKRWAARDTLGQKMMTFVDSMAAVDAKTFTIKLKEPTGLVLLGTLKKDPNVSIVVSPLLKAQYVFRPNHLHKPFDNPKIRQALWYAFNQEDFLMAAIGDENYINACKALFICDTPLASTKGMDGLLTSNVKKAQELLKEAGYDGTPVVLMHSTDLKALTNLAPVAKSLMEKAGFKVDMQSMDWQTLVARRTKKDPPNAGGWNAFLTAWVTADVMNPVSTAYLNAACDKALFGWPCDAQLEKLRDDFAREADPAKQKAIAEAVQVRAIEVTPEIPVGEYVQPVAMRKNVKGFVIAPAPVFWNSGVTK